MMKMGIIKLNRSQVDRLLVNKKCFLCNGNNLKYNLFMYISGWGTEINNVLSGGSS